jgi:hypothetical protein
MVEEKLVEEFVPKPNTMLLSYFGDRVSLFFFAQVNLNMILLH